MSTVWASILAALGAALAAVVGLWRRSARIARDERNRANAATGAVKRDQEYVDKQKAARDAADKARAEQERKRRETDAAADAARKKVTGAGDDVDELAKLLKRRP